MQDRLRNLAEIAIVQNVIRQLEAPMGGDPEDRMRRALMCSLHLLALDEREATRIWTEYILEHFEPIAEYLGEHSAVTLAGGMRVGRTRDAITGRSVLGVAEE